MKRMKRILLAGCGALVLASTLVVAQDAPESLLPPGFDDPAPRPSARPTAAPPRAPGPSITRPTASQPAPAGGGTPTVQPIPGSPAQSAVPASGTDVRIPGLPSISELENLNPDELDELLGLKPKFDMPSAARRSMDSVGILDVSEGGLPSQALANQPASLVRAALRGIKGPMVSRWGHIMMRRALVSRLAAPSSMEPAEFVALRASALNAMSEFTATRALAQDVDSENWNDGMTDAALAAYLATSDIAGACPVVQIKGGARKDPEWVMLQSICYAFLGQGSRAQGNLNRAFRNKIAPDIDVLLAQRFAGAAGASRRAVNLEWDGVTQFTPWRFALAAAVGADIPAKLLTDAEPYYQKAAALSPALPLGQRAAGVDISTGQGIFSASAAVDFYSEILAVGGTEAGPATTAQQLRQAYVGADPSVRMAAMRDLWGDGAADYARQVLTAYAAARMPPSEELSNEAPDLIASMLTAGLDADALTWAPFAPQGSQGWALLVLAQPNRATAVSSAQFDSFYSADESKDARKSQMLLAGLAGLGRMDRADALDVADTLSVTLTGQSRWSTLITQAAEVDNAPLVAFLAGVGMQGNGWDEMTPRHLYFIVAALNRVGLSAEARMIAAEAVTRA